MAAKTQAPSRNRHSPRRKISSRCGARPVAPHRFDEQWQHSSSPIGRLVRFADDWLILCRTRQGAEEALRRATAILGTLGLQLNPDKTKVICLTKGSQGLEFPGFHLHKVEAWKYPGRYYL